MKTCNTCKLEKSVSEYYIADSKTGRRSNQCKVCKSEYNRQHESKPEVAERRQKQHSEWFASNKANLQPKRTKYMFNKRKTDEQSKIANRLRATLSRIIASSQETTIRDFGASPPDIRKYIEGLFQEGMSFSNYGEWEIDHIKPVSNFDQTKEHELSECWHYTNIRPVWKSENRKKWKHY